MVDIDEKIALLVEELRKEKNVSRRKEIAKEIKMLIKQKNMKINRAIPRHKVNIGKTPIQKEVEEATKVQLKSASATAQTYKVLLSDNNYKLQNIDKSIKQAEQAGDNKKAQSLKQEKENVIVANELLREGEKQGIPAEVVVKNIEKELKVKPGDMQSLMNFIEYTNKNPVGDSNVRKGIAISKFAPELSGPGKKLKAKRQSLLQEIEAHLNEQKQEPKQEQSPHSASVDLEIKEQSEPERENLATPETLEKFKKRVIIANKINERLREVEEQLMESNLPEKKIIKILNKVGNKILEQYKEQLLPQLRLSNIINPFQSPEQEILALEDYSGNGKVKYRGGGASLADYLSTFSNIPGLGNMFNQIPGVGSVLSPIANLGQTGAKITSMFLKDKTKGAGVPGVGDLVSMVGSDVGSSFNVLKDLMGMFGLGLGKPRNIIKGRGRNYTNNFPILHQSWLDDEKEIMSIVGRKKQESISQMQRVNEFNNALLAKQNAEQQNAVNQLMYSKLIEELHQKNLQEEKLRDMNKSNKVNQKLYSRY
jgi:hypothetical protein